MDLSADFLQRRPANFRPLTPIQFLRRAADVFPDRLAVLHGEFKHTWRDYDRRCRMLASALIRSGIGKGEVVAILCPNTPAMLEAHFGVPVTGAVLNTLNTRLDAAAIAFILEHSEARALFVDRQWSAVAKEALSTLKSRPLVVDIDDPYAEGGELIGECDYEAFLKRGDPDDAFAWPADEFDAITLKTPRGQPAIPRARSIIIAAAISTRWARSSTTSSTAIPSISGRCPCSM